MRAKITFRLTDLAVKGESMRIVERAEWISNRDGAGVPVNSMLMPKVLFDDLCKHNQSIIHEKRTIEGTSSLKNTPFECYNLDGVYIFVTEDNPGVLQEPMLNQPNVEWQVFEVQQ